MAKKTKANASSKNSLAPAENEFPFGWKEESSVVVGEGWAALGAVGALINRGEKVTWISGSGVAPVSPLPTIDSGKGSSFWAKLFYSYGLLESLPQEGRSLREYRKSAFHAAAWQKGDDEEDRRALHREQLWEGEQTLLPFEELVFETAVQDLEIALREKLLQSPLLKKSMVARIAEVISEADGTVQLCFGEGESIRTKKLYYADSLESVNDIPGLPKFATTFRGKKRQSLLQVIARHPAPLQDFSESGFFGPTNRDAGEENARLVFGGFFESGNRSVWNLVIAEGETEDNQMIAKKLRRLKQGIDKMFSGPDLLPEGKEFTATWTGESVRFLENAVFFGSTAGKFEPYTVARAFGQHDEILFFSDGFGMSASGAQVESVFSAFAESEHGDMNAFSTPESQDPSEAPQSLT